jgi:hypothetical protein
MHSAIGVNPSECINVLTFLLNVKWEAEKHAYVKHIQGDAPTVLKQNTRFCLNSDPFRDADTNTLSAIQSDSLASSYFCFLLTNPTN